MTCAAVRADGITSSSGIRATGEKKCIPTTCSGRLAASASALYAKNLLTFLETMIDKKTKALAINWDDEIVKGTALTREGAVIHPNFKPKTAA